MISINLTERSPHTTTNTGLFAIGNDVIPNDVGTDILLAPSAAQRVEYNFHIM